MARFRLRARFNWAMRWGGLVLCLLVCALYRLSADRAFEFMHSNAARAQGLGVFRGRVFVTSSQTLGAFRPPPGVPERWGYKRPTYPDSWRMSLGYSIMSERHSLFTLLLVKVPLWPLGLCALLLSIFAWVRRPTGWEKAGPCPSCNYDLSGLPPGSPCPECAAKPPNHWHRGPHP